VATAGYPIAGVASGSAQTYGATPELHIGTVSGLTDFFFLPAPFAHRLLIHHSLPVTGGVSGSPIVGSSGRVVGLLNSGNFTGNQGGRFASAALVNYAQRADLIGHLLAQDNDISSVDRKYWSEQIANFPAGPDLVAKSIVRELRNSDKGRRIDFVRMSEQVARLTESVAGSLTDSADQRSVRHLVSVAGGSDYVILCYAFDGSNLQLHAFAGEQLVASSKGGTYYPWIRYQPSKDTTLTILVLGPKDRDVKYNIQVGKLQSNGPSG
jgi:hypothetical protein